MLDTLFFVVSKIAWVILRPESWLVILAVLAWLALRRNRIARARRLLGTLAISLLFIGMVPVGDLFLGPLERRFPQPDLPARIDGIIVLGGAERASLSSYWNAPLLSDSAERLTAAITLGHLYPQARVVYSGGSGAVLNQGDVGASVAADILGRSGLDDGQLTFEADSRNTFENARNTKAILTPAEGETWLLVTSAFHMPRSVGVFCKSGFRILPYPVDFKSGDLSNRIRWDLAGHLDELNTGVREWIGLLAYRLTGRIGTLFPGAETLAGCRTTQLP